MLFRSESYTSKADCTAGDFIPVYGKVKGHPVFSGRRVERGLYLCKDAGSGGGLAIYDDFFRVGGSKGYVMFGDDVIP